MEMIFPASFNYNPPSDLIVVIGWIIAISTIVGLGRFRSYLVGCLGGGFIGMVVAGIVSGCGQGDLAAFAVLVGGTMGGLSGIIGGLIVVRIAIELKRNRDRQLCVSDDIEPDKETGNDTKSDADSKK